MGVSPVHQGKRKEVEEDGEIKAAVHHDCDGIQPYHVARLPWLVAKAKLNTKMQGKSL